MVGSTQFCIKFFKALSWRSIETGFFMDLRRGLNSLNSDTGRSRKLNDCTKVTSSSGDFMCFYENTNLNICTST